MSNGRGKQSCLGHIELGDVEGKFDVDRTLWKLERLMDGVGHDVGQRLG